MLLFEERMRPQEGLKSFHLSRRWRLDPLCQRDATTEHSVPNLFPPARERERVNLESVSDRLNLDSFQLTQLHRLELELQAVALHLLGARPRHETPPIVR